MGSVIKMVCSIIHTFLLFHYLLNFVLGACPPSLATKCSDCDSDFMGQVKKVVCTNFALQAIPATVNEIVLADATDPSLMPMGIFRPQFLMGKVQLHILQVNNYGITMLWNTFMMTKSLQKLDLRRNKVGSRPLAIANFHGLDHLEELLLDQNEISNIPDKLFSMIPLLKRLSLVANHLKNINELAFSGLDKLEFLDVSENQIENIHSNTFQHTKNIRELNFQNNRLKQIGSGQFSKLVNLQTLKFRRNQLSFIASDAFRETSLQLLDLGVNKLTDIPTRALKNCNAPPQQIVLLSNQLTNLHDDKFDGLTIKRLDLQYCNLEIVWQHAFRNGEIQEVDFRNNKLHKLPKSMRSYIETHNVKMLLDKNEWTCDCDVIWIADYIQTGHLTMPTCDNPNTYHGMSMKVAVMELTDKCAPTTTSTTTTMKPTTTTTTTTTPTTTTTTPTTTTTTPTTTTTTTTTPTPTTSTSTPEPSTTTTTPTTTLSTKTTTTTTSTTTIMTTKRATTLHMFSAMTLSSASMESTTNITPNVTVSKLNISTTLFENIKNPITTEKYTQTHMFTGILAATGTGFVLICFASCILFLMYKKWVKNKIRIGDINVQLKNKKEHGMKQQKMPDLLTDNGNTDSAVKQSVDEV